MNKKLPKKKDRPGVDKYGRTPLHNAILAKDCGLIDSLINSEINIDAQDDDGFTALHFSAMNLETEIINKLLRNKATVDIQDSHGNTALWRAVFNLRDGDINILEIFLKEGANPNLKNKYGVSPYDFAQTIKNTKLIELFKKESK
ncbi:ankyrin repeat domain-containing protein [Leptospira sp. GIMC2001]|uniref:ankyrin repeat domain-containing protein n=1 Tax=Leptospira sp. GIMC2001 TaxID=1513297 RepID=UPI00234AAAEE|nr:ankyrin repeat domain-containing protein [Leptospira sp. GIMC2001]WCL50802.1 ankyrin repeat domain-containing protein [Leptospira sp. GIMC2001]